MLIKGQDIELRLGYPSCYYCMPTRNIQYGQWTQWSEWSLCQDNFEGKFNNFIDSVLILFLNFLFIKLMENNKKT